MARSRPREFDGTDRFIIRRRLGSGGMGVVYESFDRERREVVALKTMRSVEPTTIYDFKQEFRSIAEVGHPNLVSLYELINDGDLWFFTMELIDGVDFIEYTRGAAVAELPTVDGAALAQGVIGVDGPAVPPDVPRLRGAFCQLVQGVSAIHRAGKVHRDIKPSNVLVEPSGRVVILDLGLCADLHADPTARALGAIPVGTVAYMAPEQFAGAAVSEATDSYAVGVMLYESLTGRDPYLGPASQVIADKRSRDPLHPARLVAGLPDDLVEICMALLARDPAARPIDAELMRRVGGSEVELRTSFLPGARQPVLVGREEQLDRLRDALDSVRLGRTESVYLHGTSGIGKSTIVRQFLRQATAAGAVVLAGRCYVAESVPHKGLDGMMDSLSRLLRSRPPGAVARFVPPGIGALARLFPVLLRAPAVVEAQVGQPEIPDPIELRRTAIAALRDLLSRLALAQPLIVFIDDLQWADRDSASLLRELLAPPEAPPLLLIASFRSEELRSQAFLRELLRETSAVSVSELHVGPLEPAEARRLLLFHLGGDDSASEPLREAILAEAAGIPFIIEQLARFVTESTGRPAGMKLGEMLDARLQLLGDSARSLIEVLSICGHPIDAPMAYEAAGLDGDERPLVSRLQAAQLVRHSGDSRTIEPYHDRIREVIASGLDESTTRRLHRRVATALELAGLDDPELLFEHHRGAGDGEEAARHAARAAAMAGETLAFDRAAGYLRRALELSDPESPGSGELREQLGDALANAGRGVESARTYLAQSSRVDADAAVRLERKAAEQLLRSGHIDEGLAVVRRVLDSVGMRLAGSPRRALLRLIGLRAFLRIRGLRFRERTAEQIAPEIASRLDTCWAVAIGLARVDNARAADFQVRHLRLALREGDTGRVTRALAAEAAFVSTRGLKTSRRAAVLVSRAASLAERSGDPLGLGHVRLAAGIAAFYRADFRSCLESCVRAEELFRTRCRGVVWEVSTAQSYRLGSMSYLGQVGAMALEAPALIRDADQRGDLYARADVAAGRANLIWLAADDVDRARREIDDSMARWTHRDFHFQHYVAMLARAQLALYRGDVTAARDEVERNWSKLRHAHLLRIPMIRVEANYLRGRLALADGDLPAARRAQRAVARQTLPIATPIAALLGAATRLDPTNLAAALPRLERAVRGFADAGMELHAACSRLRLAQVLGPDRGSVLAAAADEWMRSQSIRVPQRIAAVFAPGFESLEARSPAA